MKINSKKKNHRLADNGRVRAEKPGRRTQPDETNPPATSTRANAGRSDVEGCVRIFKRIGRTQKRLLLKSKTDTRNRAKIQRDCLFIRRLISIWGTYVFSANHALPRYTNPEQKTKQIPCLASRALTGPFVQKPLRPIMNVSVVSVTKAQQTQPITREETGGKKHAQIATT